MKDEWVTTALSDDSIVAELLFRLSSSSSTPQVINYSILSLPSGWGHRKSRSKPPHPSSATTSAAAATNKKLLDSSTTRCSPTTPLSWSGVSGGAASPSDGAYDDCSFDPSRSKISYANEAATLSCKGSRNKKRWVDCAQTFVELKEEESFLLKERVNLTKELASMHVTIKEEKARRENLKRIKLDLNNVQTSGEVPRQRNRMETSTSGELEDELPRNATGEGCGSSSSSSRIEEEVVETGEQRGFILPDLNMIPSEEEENTTTPGILYGIS